MATPRAVLAAAVAALTVASMSGAAAAQGSGPGAGDGGARQGAPQQVQIAGAGGVAAGGSGPGPAATATPPVGQPAPDQDAVVTLLTGDRVRLDAGPAGAPSATVIAGSAGPAAASRYTTFSWQQDRYVIPDTAVPYLSGVLDPRLFDISYLVRAKLDDAHAATLPVTVEQSRTGAAGRLPAVHVSTAAGGTATAVAVKKEAGAFGQLLANHARAGGAGPAVPATGGDLDGVTRISLARPDGAPALPDAPATRPAPDRAAGTGLAYHTLTLNPIDRSGHPGLMLGFVQNVDDAQLGEFFLSGDSAPGPVNLSVPDGTYSIEVTVCSGPATDYTADSALVIKPEVAVHADETVTLDARTAQPYRVQLDPSVTTPPARLDLLSFSRSSVTGGELRVEGFGAIALHLFSDPAYGTPPLYATPTPPVTRGRLGFLAFTELVGSESAPSADPSYRLVFPSAHGVPPSLTYHVAKADLTTVRSGVYRDLSNPAAAEVYPMVYLPWTVEVLGLGAGVTPGERLDYWYSSAPDVTVWQSVFNVGSVRRWGTRRTIRPGQRISEDWNKAPAVPAPVGTYLQNPPRSADTMSATVCGACRQDDNGVLYLSPLGDSDPSHHSDGYATAATSQVRFWRDGTLAVTSDSWSTGTLGAYALALPMLPGPASYQLDWAWSRPGDPAATVDTSWTFRSSRTDPAATMPATEHCALDTSRGCAFLPLLYLTYDLRLDFSSQARAGGAFPIAFTVGHEQNAAAPQGVTATVCASYDGGRTWTATQAATAQGGGRFAATVTHPSLAGTDGYVALRVTAHDGAGNTVAQTILRAYALTQ